MSPLVPIVLYSLCVLLASLAGGWLPTRFRLTHTRVQMLMSFVGGLMLGIGLFHLLPHAVGGQVTLDRAIGWMVVGLLTTFFLIRVFHFHQHAPPPGEAVVEHDDHGHPHEQPNQHHHSHVPGAKHKWSWIGVTLGLTLHTLLDGVALAAAVMFEMDHAGETAGGEAAAVVGLPLGGYLFGVAVFLGILLHKPLDSLSITALMAAGGWPLRTRQIVNLGYALMCPLGAALFYFGVYGTAQQDQLVGCALAFAAGIFVCIALGDLLPELQFHSHDRIKLSLLVLLGIGAAYGIGYLEPAHIHAHDRPGVDSPHDHSGHEHGQGNDER